MKDLIFITAYCPTEEQERVLEKCVNSVLECGKHIALISHTHIPIHIQKKCQYYVYDHNNEISDDYNLLGHQHFKFGNNRIQSRFFNKYFYGFAIYRMFSIAFQIAINFGYQNIHHIEYDGQLLDKNLIDGVELYDYQVDLTNGLIKYKRGIICAPTGAGKSLIMVSILKSLPDGCPSLVLANKKSLVEQNYEEIVKHGFKNVGRLYGKYKDPGVITCATVQSLHKMESLLDKIKVLIVDEIHENMSKEPKKYFNKMKSCSVRAAVSATPFKFGGKDMCQKWLVKGYFGPSLKSKSAGGVMTTSHLQERGMLSGSRCIFYPVREPDLKYEVYMDAVTRGIAENWHFHEIIKRLTSKLEGRTLILVERIAQGDSLASLIPGSIWVQGKDDLDTRKMVIERLKYSTEKVVAIATQQIFTAGINVMTHNVINAAGGQAEHHIIQRMGRGLRTADDKDVLSYYDFIFQNNDYLLEHSKKRMKILKKEGHEVTVGEL
jgi:superfamily II DNA or RNA helicase